MEVLLVLAPAALQVPASCPSLPVSRVHPGGGGDQGRDFDSVLLDPQQLVKFKHGYRVDRKEFCARTSL